jgi:hypothetical protein
LDGRLQLLCLAFADVVFGCRFVESLAHSVHYRRARSIGELGQLVEVLFRCLCRNVFGGRADQDSALIRCLDIFQNDYRLLLIALRL